MKNETAAALWSACLEIVRKTTSNDVFEQWFLPSIDFNIFDRKSISRGDAFLFVILRLF